MAMNMEHEMETGIRGRLPVQTQGWGKPLDQVFGRLTWFGAAGTSELQSKLLYSKGFS